MRICSINVQFNSSLHEKLALNCIERIGYRVNLDKIPPKFENTPKLNAKIQPANLEMDKMLWYILNYFIIRTQRTYYSVPNW